MEDFKPQKITFNNFILPITKLQVSNKRRLQDLQTGEANDVNIVLKCFNRFPIPKLWDRKSVKAFQNNVYLSCLASLQVYSLCLSHTVKLHSTPSPKE